MISGCHQHKCICALFSCLSVFWTSATTTTNFPVFFPLLLQDSQYKPLPSQWKQNALLGIELKNTWFWIHLGEIGKNFLLDINPTSETEIPAFPFPAPPWGHGCGIQVWGSAAAPRTCSAG